MPSRRQDALMKKVAEIRICRNGYLHLLKANGRLRLSKDRQLDGSDFFLFSFCSPRCFPNAIKKDRAKCMNAGMNDYLAKPIDSQALAERLEIWMQDTGSSRNPSPDRNKSEL